ncbi:MAG: DUF2157 domain-containing protein [Candidatus Avelusimicrobium sp.]
MIQKSLLDEFLLRGFITRETYDKALPQTAREPVQSWLLRRLLSVGAALVLAGVVCFFAYNWDKLGVFYKFALPLLGILLCGAGAWTWGVKSGLGQACCVGAGIFSGTFLAVYGQEFQTGAFVYELFGAWSVILVILAIASGVRWVWLAAFYVFCIYVDSKLGLQKSYWPMLGTGLAAWAVTETVIYFKKWPASFRLWLFVPLWTFVTGYGLLFPLNWHRYSDPECWVLPVFCALCAGAGLKLKSPAVLCCGAFSLAAFLCVVLVEQRVIYDFFGIGLMCAVLFCGAGVAAWRGIRYIKGDK